MLPAPDSLQNLERRATVNDVSSSEEVPVNQRPMRERRPALRLSYDELGLPCDQPVTVLIKVMLMGSGISNVAGSSCCRTDWCYPKALC